MIKVRFFLFKVNRISGGGHTEELEEGWIKHVMEQGNRHLKRAACGHGSKFGGPCVRGKIVLCEATYILGAEHREEKMFG